MFEQAVSPHPLSLKKEVLAAKILGDMLRLTNSERWCSMQPPLLTTKLYFLPARHSRIIKIDAQALRSMFDLDRHMAYLLTYQATKAAIERLYATRVQLAAAWV